MSEMAMADPPGKGLDPAATPPLNKDFAWDQFDSDAYFRVQLPEAA
jgi:hypothetical protein